MIVIRKERETSQQLLRRFNRALQANNKLRLVREKMHFTKELNRFARKTSAVRRSQLRDERQWY